MKKKLIIMNIIVCIMLSINIHRISSLTGWIDKIFASKYEKADMILGGPQREDEQGEFEAELLEFDGKFNTHSQIVVKVTNTGDRALFKNGDEVCIKGSMEYYNEATGESIYVNENIPEEMQVKIGDEVTVHYSWHALQFEYSNCFFSSLIKKDDRKYIGSGVYVYKEINLPEE